MSYDICSNSINFDGLIKSVISKMMYTCNDPQCKHRANRNYCSVCTTGHYNCAGFPRDRSKSKSPARDYARYRTQYYTNNRNTCECLANSNYSNNPQQKYGGYNSKIYNSNVHHSSYHDVMPAGDYSREQDRGRWINNSIHDGSFMKQTLYESQNPRAQIQLRRDKAENYDRQYEKLENKIMRTRASRPKSNSKIAPILKRDKLRSN